MIIKKLPVLERPYEKAQMYGIENLSNAELLAIIIKTGTKEKTGGDPAMQFQKKRCVAMLLAGGQGSRLMVLTENTA